MATLETTIQRGEFVNEPLVDFSRPENRTAIEAALKKVAGELGREYPLIIEGREHKTADKLRSINPSHADQVVGIFNKATAELAKRAIEDAHRYFDVWKRVPAEERAEILFRSEERRVGKRVYVLV